MRILLSFVVGVAVVSRAVAQDGKRFALLVGVKNYNHSGLDDLQFTERDVTELKKVLEEGGFRVTLLTTTEGKGDPSKAPTKANIDAAISKVLTGVGKHDLVLVALAGHGLQPTGSSEQFFCPFDANPDKKSNLVSLAALSQEMQSSGAGAKLLLVDACRNDPDPGRGRSGVEGNLYRLPPTASNFMAMFSCCAGQKAYETDKAGGGHGVFFFHVLEGLKGAAKDQHGEENEVTWASLSSYVQRKVPGAVRTWIGKEKEQRVHAVANVDRESVVLREGVRLGKPLINPAITPEEMLQRLDRNSKTTETSNRPDREMSKSPGNRDVSNDVITVSSAAGMKLKLIPVGRFTFGSPSTEKGREKYETQREVQIAKPFYLGITEVTQAQWKAVMGTEPWKGKQYAKEGGEYPATYVSVKDAEEFCRKLGQLEGKEYRLPTEEEWEYACRAATSTAYNFGEEEGPLSDHAWYEKNAMDMNESYAHAVALKRPNRWGLFDMHGNVWEWTSSRYPQGDPVTRGGGWTHGSECCRSAHRGVLISDGDGHLGFRVVQVR